MQAGSFGCASIFIGTAAVIWLVAMGEVSATRLNSRSRNTSDKRFVCHGVEPTQDETQFRAAASARGLLRDDYKRIISNIQYLSSAVPIRELQF